MELRNSLPPLSSNAVLEASVLNGRCVSVEAIGSFLAATAGGMYESLVFTNETVDVRKAANAVQKAPVLPGIELNGARQ